MKPVLLLTALLLCTPQPAVTLVRAQGQSPQGYPAMGEPPILTVLATGAVPRRPLRYGISNGRRDHLNMDMLMTMAMNMDGVAMPAVQIPTLRMGADLAVTSVSAAGDVSYTLSFTGMAAISAPGDNPAIAALVQGFDADIKSIQGTATVSNRGISRDVHFDFSKAPNAQFAQIMSSLSSSLETLSMPLPEEAVGVGARWEVRRAAVAGGVRSFQKYEFELVAMDDAGCTLTTKIEQSAPAQVVTNPSLPPGIEASLETMSGTGTGTMTLRLDSLVPTSETNLQSTAIMNVAAGGVSQRMTVETTIKLTIAPVK